MATYKDLIRDKDDDEAWYGPRTEDELKLLLSDLYSGEYLKYTGMRVAKDAPTKFGFQYDLTAGIRKFGVRIKNPNRMCDSFEYDGRKYEEFWKTTMIDIKPSDDAQYDAWLD